MNVTFCKKIRIPQNTKVTIEEVQFYFKAIFKPIFELATKRATFLIEKCEIRKGRQKGLIS